MFGDSGIVGDFGIGVQMQMDMFLTTKGKRSILMFDQRKFFSLLSREYERAGFVFSGQRIYMADMNELGPRSVRTYYKLKGNR